MKGLLSRLRRPSEQEIFDALLELEEEGYVESHVSDQGDLWWSLTEKGRKYQEEKRRRRP